MKLRKTILATVAGLCLSGSATMAGHPDVLMIIVDDLNDWVGFLDGHPQAKTPNMDRLARRGVSFSNAHAQSSRCNPSRVGVMSGRYATSTKIYDNKPEKKFRRLTDRVLAESETLPQCFVRNGYWTEGVGKIFHTWEELNNERFFQNGGPVYDYQYKKPRRNKKAGIKWNWGISPEDEKDYYDTLIADWACERMEGRKNGQPRFMAVGFYRPHGPLYAPQKYYDLFEPEEQLTLPPNRLDDRSDIPSWVNEQFPPNKGWYAEFEQHGWHHEITQAYLACVAFADAQVGRVLDALERSGRADSTYVVLFSDHGFHIGEKEKWGKGTLWRASTRVPLIIAGPGVKQGEECGKAVGLIDIYPTLAELCDLSAPETLEGRSLVPLLRNPTAEWNYPTFSTMPESRGSHAVVSERFRYIRYEDGSEELYDIEKDPDEFTNLAENPEYAQIVVRHRQWLREYPNAELGTLK